MTIGDIILPDQYTPLECTKPRAERTIAIVNTNGGVAVFDWGSILSGKEIKLTWKSMTVVLFDALDELYQAGDVIIWDSGIGDKSYHVKIKAFDGSLLFDRKNEYMLDITMNMVILSEVET